ncbi:MAG: phosphatidate cytidylyltransferase [Brumimicrobium sp.]
MSNILTRTIYGGLFIALVMGAFLLGEYVSAVALGGFMILGLLEFYKFFSEIENPQVKPVKFIGLFGGIILFSTLIVLEVTQYDFDILLVLIPLFFLPLFSIVFSREENPLLNLTVTFFSWIYILLPFYIMFKIYLFESDVTFQWTYVIGFFILVWSNDTFAYLSGRFFGKHKFFERISPKKTWEGAIGGFLMTIVFGIIYTSLFDKDYLFWITAAIFVSPVSILGDLIESRFKRLYNIKDSGTILPGHGGVLDRFDASLYAAPFFYLLLVMYF